MKSIEIRSEDEEGLMYSLRYGSEWISTIYRAPTSNCQIYSIGGIQEILSKKDSTFDILKIIQNKISKTQLLVDIYDNKEEENGDYYSKAIESIFKEEDIIFKTPYINNTGSTMTMYLLHTRNLK